MENIHFEGLEKALRKDCSVKVFNGKVFGHSKKVGIIEKNGKIFKKRKIVTNAAGGNVIRTLTRLSIGYYYIDEFDYIDKLSKDEIIDMFYSETAIDKILNWDCNSLQLYKLSNGQILTAICTSYDDDNIPIKSIISNDIVSGIKTLNAALQDYDLDCENNFMDFVNSHISSVKAYKKS